MALDLFIILVLSVFGIALLIAEIFVIPGFGVAGIAGLLFMGGSVWFAYDQLGAFGGNITLLISGIFFLVAVILFIKSKMLNKMALKREITYKVSNEIDSSVKVGDKAVTISRISPMGSILLNGKKIEAKSLTGFIDENTDVIIEKIENTVVIIREA